MKRPLPLASLLCTTALMGCSPFARAPAEPGPKTASATLATSALASPLESLFQQGRNALGAGRTDQAEAYFNHVVWQEPRHVGALNALAVVYAQTGRSALAQAYFARALAVDPQAAHVHNNLGYALLLQGRLDEAEAALHRAQALQPDSASTRDNLALLAQTRQRPPIDTASVAGTPTPVQPAAPSPAVTAVTAVTAAPPATASAPQATGQQLVAISPNVYVLRDATPLSAAAPPLPAAGVTRPSTATVAPPAANLAVTPTAIPAPQAQLKGLRIEVSNGVGIRHLAKRTADRLAPLGVITARLTNQPSYTQLRTEIQYGAQQQSAAEALARQLPGTIRTVPTQALGPQIQMRLVLGHDRAGQAIATWLEQGSPQPTPAQQAEALAPVAPAATQDLAQQHLRGWRWS